MIIQNKYDRAPIFINFSKEKCHIQLYELQNDVGGEKMSVYGREPSRSLNRGIYVLHKHFSIKKKQGNGSSSLYDK